MTNNIKIFMETKEEIKYTVSRFACRPLDGYYKTAEEARAIAKEYAKKSGVPYTVNAEKGSTCQVIETVNPCQPEENETPATESAPIDEQPKTKNFKAVRTVYMENDKRRETTKTYETYEQAKAYAKRYSKLVGKATFVEVDVRYNTDDYKYRHVILYSMDSNGFEMERPEELKKSPEAPETEPARADEKVGERCEKISISMPKDEKRGGYNRQEENLIGYRVGLGGTIYQNAKEAFANNLRNETIFKVVAVDALTWNYTPVSGAAVEIEGETVVDVINCTRKGDTINFKFALYSSPKWAPGIYWGNAELVENALTEESNYYVARETFDGERAVLGSRTYEDGGDECDCEACFDRHTEGWSEDEKARLRNDLDWNGQHVCGTGKSLPCPYNAHTDEQQGIKFDDVENLLKTAGLLKEKL